MHITNICRSTFGLLLFVHGWHLTSLVQFMKTSCCCFCPRTGEDISPLYLQQDTVDNNSKGQRDTALLPPQDAWQCQPRCAGDRRCSAPCRAVWEGGWPMMGSHFHMYESQQPCLLTCLAPFFLRNRVDA